MFISILVSKSVHTALSHLTYCLILHCIILLHKNRLNRAQFVPWPPLSRPPSPPLLPVLPPLPASVCSCLCMCVNKPLGGSGSCEKMWPGLNGNPCLWLRKKKKGTVGVVIGRELYERFIWLSVCLLPISLSFETKPITENQPPHSLTLRWNQSNSLTFSEIHLLLNKWRASSNYFFRFQMRESYVNKLLQPLCNNANSL